MDECSDKEKDTLRFIISEEQVGQRLDKALAALADGFSRSRLQGIIQDGALHLNGLVCRDVSHKVSLGSVIEIEIPPVKRRPRNLKKSLLMLFMKMRTCW